MLDLYTAMGGAKKISELTATFLRKAMADDLLGAMFAGKLDHAEHIASYFEANFGGPDDYYHQRGDLRFLVAQHAGLAITEPQRQRWVEFMVLSAKEVGVADDALKAFAQYLQYPSLNTMTFSNLPEKEALAQLGYHSRPEPRGAATHGRAISQDLDDSLETNRGQSS